MEETFIPIHHQYPIHSPCHVGQKLAGGGGGGETGLWGPRSRVGWVMVVVVMPESLIHISPLEYFNLHFRTSNPHLCPSVDSTYTFRLGVVCSLFEVALYQGSCEK